MNLSKKVTYIITFLIVFLLLPYGIYRFYFWYQVDLYPSLSDYEEYTGADGKYTVSIKDTNQYGSEDTLVLKVYLVDNDSGEVTFIERKRFNTLNSEITYGENKSGSANEIIVTFKEKSSTDKLLIDCNEKKKE
jgi:hypothetical protein